MAIRNPTDLLEALPKGTRLLGLDLGTRTIGMAVADPVLRIASPVGTVRRTKLANDLAALARAVRDWNVGGFVLGLPLNMDGSFGPAADRTRSFADSLLKNAEALGIEPEIAFQDERLTSFEAEERMRAAGASRRRRGESIDAAAAAVILQEFLDSLPRTA